MLTGKKMKKLYILSILTLLGAACTWEDLETLYPHGDLCDTLNISYLAGCGPDFFQQLLLLSQQFKCP